MKQPCARVRATPYAAIRFRSRPNPARVPGAFHNNANNSGRTCGLPCPTCGSDHVVYLENARLWKCYVKHSRAKFSLKTGTIFEDSRIGLEKWLPVMWMVVNCKNGVSSWEIHRAIGVTQKSAWFMLQRCRLAMQDDLTGGNLGGEVEVDETFIGGKARNMHAERRRRTAGGANKGKTIVLGMLARGGKVRASVIPDRTKTTIRPIVGANVDEGSQVYTDEFGWQWVEEDKYLHEMVNHLDEYVSGNVHTNSPENFWSLLKRAIAGTYISVEPFHLFRYVDEQALRFNNRTMTDELRFRFAMRHILGRRLTYKELTGKLAGSGFMPI